MSYNSYSSNLYHFGIKGMKWGRRRYQNEDGSLTPAGKNRYNATTADKIVYGKKGAQRIADRRNNGDSRKKAVAKEVGRRAATGLAISVAGAASVYALTSGKAGQAVAIGKKMVENYMNNHNNVSVLDKSGKVIARYHENIKVGEAVVNSLIKKG